MFLNLIKTASRKENLSIFLGLALSGPFIEALIPVKGVSVLFTLLFVTFTLKAGIPFAEISNRLRNSGYFLLIFFIYVSALALTPQYVFGNSYFLLQFTCIYLLYLLTPSKLNKDEVWYGFFVLFFPLTLLVAVLGIFKAFLLERGYFIGPLYEIYTIFGTDYPWGSSIRSDYNLFSVSLLVCACFLIIGEIGRAMDRRIRISALFIIVLAIYYSSSRRGLLFLMSLPMLSIAYDLYLKRFTLKMSLITFLKSVLMAVMIYFSGILVLTGLRFDEYKLLPSLGVGSTVKQYHVSTLAAVPFPKWLETKIIDFYRERGNVIGLSDATPYLENRKYVSYERTARWKFAKEILMQQNFIFPVGFDYQSMFGCKFAKCETKDYPHNVFLSEWLVGGILGLVLCLWVFLSHALRIFRMRNDRVKAKVLILSFFCLPNLLISGDYLFTSGMGLAVLMLALIFSDRVAKEGDPKVDYQ